MNDPKISLLLMAVLFAAMYFIAIKPQKKKEKEILQMRDTLKVGDDVVTIGGIYGKILRVRDDKVVIQVGADKTRLEFAKWAISENLSDPTKERAKEDKGKFKDEDDEDDEKAASRPNPKKFRRLGADSEEEEEGGADEE